MKKKPVPKVVPLNTGQFFRWVFSSPPEPTPAQAAFYAAKVEEARTILREALPTCAQLLSDRLDRLDVDVARWIARPGKRKGHWLVDGNLLDNLRALGRENLIDRAIAIQQFFRKTPTEAQRRKLIEKTAKLYPAMPALKAGRD